jgi:hypothetical protein
MNTLETIKVTHDVNTQELHNIAGSIRSQVRTMGPTQMAAKLKLVHNIQMAYQAQSQGTLPEVLTSSSLLLCEVMPGVSLRDVLCLSGKKEYMRIGQLDPRACDYNKANGDKALALTYSIAHAELQEARGILRQLGLMGLVQGGDERVCGNLEKNHYKSRGRLVAINTWNEDSHFNEVLESNSYMPLTDKEFCVAMGLGW